MCRGVNCAVRHGLYYRCVVEADGSMIQHFPIPRFLCLRRGPLRPKASTFSVLPPTLVPRRRFSLPLMLLMVDLVGRWQSIPRVLDELARRDRGLCGALIVEETAVFRVLSLFAQVRRGLDAEAARLVGVRPDSGGRRGRALALGDALLGRHPPPASPLAPILRFHQRFFPRLLFDAHTR